ncbi:DUF2933 domain-containing protein [Sphingobium sp. H39-3-25]|uniref:DUF2933 domain-containing protein n=1 Tax=Sphingobium arseniciresistens TaxID=3030834 RepID=UPI0023BA0BDD|nr:DUF2933 domain-containing protein [Sphingobium arseniciresistens]
MALIALFASFTSAFAQDNGIMDEHIKSFATMMATAVAAAVLFWFLRDHWQHAFGVLPYLLFLACPLMHLFMHRGHRHHGARSHHPPTE